LAAKPLVDQPRTEAVRRTHMRAHTEGEGFTNQSLLRTFPRERYYTNPPSSKIEYNKAIAMANHLPFIRFYQSITSEPAVPRSDHVKQPAKRG
jgi:hypothetical protein